MISYKIILFPQNPSHWNITLNIWASLCICSWNRTHVAVRLQCIWSSFWVWFVKSRNSQAVFIYEICFYLRVVVYVEPDISVLVPILCLVCKLNPSHLKVMMMLSMKFFSFPISTSLTKFTCYSTWYIKYIYENIKPGPHFMSGL